MRQPGFDSSWSEPKMRRSLTCSVVVLTLGASLSAQRAPTTGARAVATVKQLHGLMISPASDAVFDASANLPGDPKRWTAAHDQAIVLAEAGNLLMMGSRARDNDNWMKMSRALVDAAALAASAAEKRDATALEAATDSITMSCETC